MRLTELVEDRKDRGCGGPSRRLQQALFHPGAAENIVGRLSPTACFSDQRPVRVARSRAPPWAGAHQEARNVSACSATLPPLEGLPGVPRAGLLITV